MVFRTPLFLIVFSMLLMCIQDAGAESSSKSELNCGMLSDALRQKKLSEDFFNKFCRNSIETSKVNALYSAPSVDHILEAIATHSPTMLKLSKSYGSPKDFANLLAKNTLDNRRSLLSALKWSSYRELSQYITSEPTNYYIEETLFPQASEFNKRFTTLFWIALRSGDAIFLRNVMNSYLSPYYLENDPLKSNAFPCAANIYLCVVKSEDIPQQDKQDIIFTLEAFTVNAPSWSKTAIWKEFSKYNIRYLKLDNSQICKSIWIKECDFIIELLKQSNIAADTGNSTFNFSDYSGYDAAGKRHLLTGHIGNDIMAAWVSTNKETADISTYRSIEIISKKVADGKITQYKDQVGKKIRYFERSFMKGILMFNDFESGYTIRIIEKSLY